MKRKLLLLTLYLVLILVALMPSSALAKPDEPTPAPMPFSAIASVMVVYPGQSEQLGPQIKTTGEIITGTFTDVQGWDAVKGATLLVTHNSVITLSPPGAEGIGSFHGTASAIVVVSLSNNSSGLSGRYYAKLNGEYRLDNGSPVIVWVRDVGTFEVTGLINATSVQASGPWSASLFRTQVAPDTYTLAGTAHLRGTYQKIGER